MAFSATSGSINLTVNTTLDMANKINIEVSTLLLIRSYKEARTRFPAILSINLIIILLGVIVNAVISYVMVREKRYKRNRSNFFITHLSLLELVYRLLVFPVMISLEIPSSEPSTFQCKAKSFFSETCASAIFLSLVAIAMDRHQNIIQPLETLKSERKPVLLVCLVWMLAAVVSCPLVISMKSLSLGEIPEARGMSSINVAKKKLCDIPQSSLGQWSTTLYFVLAFLVPLAVIFAVYTKIAVFLRQRSQNGMMNKLAARSKSKAVRMLTITVIAYVLSLGPAVVLNMLRSYGAFNETSFDVMLLVSWVVELATYTSSLGNPVIYAYYNGDFRKELRRLLCKRKSKYLVSSKVTFSNTRNGPVVTNDQIVISTRPEEGR